MASRFILPKEARLRQHHQYEVVRKKGTFVRGSLFHFSCISEPALTRTTQCGVIVSRRVGGAVLRNKIKRRLRDLYRHDRANLVPGVWLVVIATSKAASASMTEFRSEWLRLGRRLSIFVTL